MENIHYRRAASAAAAAKGRINFFVTSERSEMEWDHVRRVPLHRAHHHPPEASEPRVVSSWRKNGEHWISITQFVSAPASLLAESWIRFFAVLCDFPFLFVAWKSFFPSSFWEVIFGNFMNSLSSEIHESFETWDFAEIPLFTLFWGIRNQFQSYYWHICMRRTLEC